MIQGLDTQSMAYLVARDTVKKQINGTSILWLLLRVRTLTSLASCADYCFRNSDYPRGVFWSSLWWLGPASGVICSCHFSGYQTTSEAVCSRTRYSSGWSDWPESCDEGKVSPTFTSVCQRVSCLLTLIEWRLLSPSYRILTLQRRRKGR